MRSFAFNWLYVRIVVTEKSAIADAREFDTIACLRRSVDCSLWIGGSILISIKLWKTLSVNVWGYIVKKFGRCKLSDNSNPTLYVGVLLTEVKCMIC